jgi:hypothetical protein
MDLKELWCEVVNWINLVQDRDSWSAFVNMVTKLRVPKIASTSRLAEEILASIKHLYLM